LLQRLKDNWHELARDKPGHRFQNRYRQRKKQGSNRGRFVKLAIAIALLIVGAVLLVIPGPGSVLIVLGAALLAEQSLTVARWFDRSEIWLRKLAAHLRRRWRSAGIAARCAVIFIALMVLGAVAAAGVRLIQ
jgi:cytochrome c-type biogenesis protein CcmH/NrfG